MIAATDAARWAFFLLPPLAFGLLLFLTRPGLRHKASRRAIEAQEGAAILAALVLTGFGAVGLFISFFVLEAFMGENTNPTGWHADPDAWQREVQFGGAVFGFVTILGALVYLCFRRRDEAFVGAILGAVGWGVWLGINST